MKFCRKDGVGTRREGNKMLVFDSETGRFRILNSTSSFLWEHCTGKLTPEQIARLLPARFEIPEAYAEPSELLNLVTRHLELLQKARLLEVTAA